MFSARPAATIACTIGALLAAAPALAEIRPVAVTTQPVVQATAAQAPAASGEVRDIVQTAFFQALTAPAPATPR